MIGMDHSAGFTGSPWAAVLGHHPSEAHGYPPAHAHPSAPMPMDLHVPQGFPYYRYREEALCWSDRMVNTHGLSLVHEELQHGSILELRKEKSRDAARSRRGKENFEFYELAKMLPLPAAITSQLDKASIIRLTISYLKLRDFSGHGDPPWSRDHPSSKSVKGGLRSRTPAGIAMEMFEQHQGTHILQSLDGFAFALAADGRFLYISETVSIYLGLSQVEMTGSSVFDYVHHQDHSEMAEQLGLGLAQGQGLASPSSAASEEGTNNTASTANPDVSSLMALNATSTYKGLERAFCVRMKSTLTKRGCHFKSSGYRVVLLLCRLRPQYTFSHSRKSAPPLMGMVSLAIALPPPSVHEIRLESDMFVTRINFDFRIAHCEPRVADLLDYTAEEITGMNLYTLCHGEDANKLRKSHIDLINKGQVLTHYYRVMNKNGGYTWMQTCATVVCNSKNAEEQNIICVNYVVSGKEYKNMIMDCCQLEENIAQRGVKREEAGGNDPENGSPDADKGDGRNSGASRNHDHHLSPPDLEDSSEGSGDPQRGRGHLEHASQLQAPDRTQVLTARPPKKTEEIQQRGQKRKLSGTQREDESSCCSSEDEERLRKRYPVLSPASSSCHSVPVGSPKPTMEESDTGGTSVKDLEHAMSKHLPVALDKTPTDFSTDTLLKQQQKSTIQWIGALPQHAQPGAPLPASALLRQLYANRESVIRANVHAGRTGTAGSYYTGDMGPLPTPPGSEGSYGDQFVLSHNQKSGDTFGGLVSSYSAPGSYTVDYHSAMTPPSSVSPRDKHQQVHNTFDNPSYTDVLRHQYNLPLGADSPAQPLPLKPQPYPVHPTAIDYATSGLDQSQFYHSAGFHLYHPNKTANASPAVYPETLKNSANWYSTPS
ncbi:protein trachealess-like isoform X2 [Macrosteles quadrilineatus]|uniref:protein trachealess-like isoform X2 n=1 Tax=Macrosteles quadrilineatus TaxID=74068 RepID=UPI0023E1ED5A|nr:protein trachealess-like isoform X2 [Macrosteles quadrilineatus]